MQENIEVDVSASAYVCKLSRTQRHRSTWEVNAQELPFRGGLKSINRHCKVPPDSLVSAFNMVFYIQERYFQSVLTLSRHEGF